MSYQDFANLVYGEIIALMDGRITTDVRLEDSLRLNAVFHGVVRYPKRAR